MRAALFVAAAYFLGAVPFGLIIASVFSSIDVRRAGSGNIGATNVIRTAGLLPGLLTLVLDFAKGAFPAYIALKTQSFELACITGSAAFLGHITSPYLKFKGGKGVATSLGVVAVIFPKLLIPGLLVAAIALIIARKVSVASLSGSLAVFISSLLMAPNPVKYMTLGFAVLIYIRHISNIQRLIKGEEPTFTLKR